MAFPIYRHIALLAVGLIAQSVQHAPLKVFTDLGLTAKQIASIDSGQPVAKVVSWGGPSDIYVFGAVHIDASPEVYLEAARNVGRLSGAPGYQGVGELRENATVADLAALAFDPDDVKALKDCKAGSCDVQLPTAAIQAFHDGVNWSRPDAAEQANALARPMVLQLLKAYQSGGNRALGEYRDKEHPARIGDQFKKLIGRASALPDVLPGMRRYLLDTRTRSSPTPIVSSIGKRCRSA